MQCTVSPQFLPSFVTSSFKTPMLDFTSQWMISWRCFVSYKLSYKLCSFMPPHLKIQRGKSHHQVSVNCILQSNEFLRAFLANMFKREKKTNFLQSNSMHQEVRLNSQLSRKQRATSLLKSFFLCSSFHLGKATAWIFTLILSVHTSGFCFFGEGGSFSDDNTQVQPSYLEPEGAGTNAFTYEFSHCACLRVQLSFFLLNNLKKKKPVPLRHHKAHCSVSFKGPHLTLHSNLTGVHR